MNRLPAFRYIALGTLLGFIAFIIMQIVFLFTQNHTLWRLVLPVYPAGFPPSVIQGPLSGGILPILIIFIGGGALLGFIISIVVKRILGKQSFLFQIVIVGIAVFAFYLSIFWLAWILFAIIGYLLLILLIQKYKNIKSLRQKNKATFIVPLLLILLILTVFLINPIQRILVITSLLTTKELIKTGLTQGFSYNRSQLTCSVPYGDCDYENTRNYICHSCFTRFSRDDCSWCFWHDTGTALCGTTKKCRLVW